MAVPRVTTKGQVTIPRAVRSAMGIKAGDGVMFVIEGDHAIMVPVKKQSLSQLYGSLPVPKPYPGATEIRRVVRDHVAKHVVGEQDDSDER